MDTEVNYRTFLRSELDKKIKKNPSFSLRAFAKTLGVSVSHMSRVLSGQKSLSLMTGRQIAQALRLSEKETELFLDLIELEITKTVSKKVQILDRIQKKNQGQLAFIVDAEAFKVISDWIHFAILNLINVKGFKADSKWIARRLGVSSNEAQAALRRLEDLGYIRLNGGKCEATYASIETTNDVRSEAIQLHHRQLLEKAIASLSCDDVNSREFHSVMLSFKKEDLKRAKEQIRQFVDKFEKQFESKEGDDVYQLGTHFFKLTKELT